jgi:hypothetical protein
MEKRFEDFQKEINQQYAKSKRSWTIKGEAG